MSKGKVISTANNKGGIGKTITSAALGELLAYLNNDVLLIDGDPQSNLSLQMGFEVEDSEDIVKGYVTVPEDLYNISELYRYRFREKEKVQAIIKPTRVPGLDIIPSSKRHKNTLTHLLMDSTGNPYPILKRALATIRDDYDYIIIDTAPADDLLIAINFYASDFVLIPLRVEESSKKGLRETVQNVLTIKQEFDLDLQIAGAFITAAEPYTVAYREMRQEYIDEVGGIFKDCPVRKDTNVSNLQRKLQPMLPTYANSNFVYDYCNLLLQMDFLDPKSKAALEEILK